MVLNSVLLNQKHMCVRVRVCVFMVWVFFSFAYMYKSTVISLIFFKVGILRF